MTLGLLLQYNCLSLSFLGEGKGRGDGGDEVGGGGRREGRGERGGMHSFGKRQTAQNRPTSIDVTSWIN